MLVVTSITAQSLWDNDIPHVLKRDIYNNSEYNTESLLVEMPRHHKTLIFTFRKWYGYYLESCNYASLYVIHDRYYNYYTIEQISCYNSIKYPETIKLQKNKWLRDYCKMLSESLNDEREIKRRVEEKRVEIYNETSKKI